MKARQTPIKRFKEINCKVCGKPCKSGKLGMCDSHYNAHIKNKAKIKEKTLKLKERRVKARIKKKNTPTAKKLWDITSRICRYLKPLDTCCTCNKVLTFYTCQGGHFKSRGFFSTKYDLRNVDPQCRDCNLYNYGYEYEHGEFIKRRDGQKALDFILDRVRNDKTKSSPGLIKELFELYSEYELIASEAREHEKEFILKELIDKYEEIYQRNK